MSQYIETNYCIYNWPEVTSYQGYTKITLYLNLLYPLQHGFRSKLSCETQLLTFSQAIFDSMASGKQIDVAVTDFSIKD